ncbi:copper resistance protein CopC [Kutzneria sp. NPDC051319]|uniref:copper resistance CopC/CopD family protein n=1 Tax=Kutzneria sp. NPDC051319 TaxID=3155047 RepID=UPI00342C9FF2
MSLDTARPLVPVGTRGRAPWIGPVRMLLAGLVVLYGLLVGAPAPAYAHAQLLSTSPANGDRLSAAPAVISLRFGEGVNLVPDGIQLIGPKGPVPSPSPVRIDAARSSQVDVPVAAGLGPGAYTVTWRVVSNDSHPVHGAFVFAVGDIRLDNLAAGDAQTGDDPALSAVFTAARWTGYAGLALLAGGLAFLLLCWRPGLSRPRARGLLVTGWWLSVGAAVASLLLQGPYAAGSGLAGLIDPAPVLSTLGTAYGWFVAARMALLAAIAVLWRRVDPARRGGTIAAVTPVVALAGTWIGTGHAAAQADPLSALADVLHLAAMACWLGGLAVIVWCLLPRTQVQPVAEVRIALNRFSRVAAGSVALLVATGVVRALIEVGSLSALTGSSYGVLLVFKIAALGVLLWFAAVSRAVVRRRYARAEQAVGRKQVLAEQERERLARKQLRLSVRSEAVIGIGVLALTAVLVATPPGARPAQAVSDVQLALDKGRAVVRLDPPKVGASTFTAAVYDASGGAWDVPEVTATLELPDQHIGPMTVSLARSGAGRYASHGLILPRPGSWRLELTVRTTDVDEQTVETEFPVG